MFNLLVKSGGWDEHSDWLTPDRVFEYTAERLVQQFKPDGRLAFDLLRSLPAFFIPELGSGDGEQGRVATITGLRTSQRRVGIEYSFNPDYPPIPMASVEQLADQLDIDRFEFSRTHWAIKDVDLFRELSLEREGGAPQAIDSASLTHEAWLRDAVDLVRATRTVDVQLRAVAIVREVIEPWVDFGGERAYFARQMLLGLEFVQEFIENDAPAARATVVASLLANVQAAVNWANENHYLRFAGQLILVREVIAALV